ncbi:WecB/TagA/CpsF family glycosyltransferase [bacterium]|jgi:N-acetylglucosaminyldiphosphoundecaprenol N-acetyl-beta-D-mannosaminyltransferase|nr:WecB/TagA/CpsF family glycosyltransferase [bacterium]MBT4250829.1 WecB/TagA/CpsF family glycosyltransferase [bacterium]MBT4597541.1 WecB/TagA/CpsF family glycosyltransferase [bacterium]MBT6754007.1 WecB/TagA/CpsF family glycosyltransferase [bacterium]MBT7037535.1 WecB/TagA/CpsF family glycosyltransferase [bacterium]
MKNQIFGIKIHNYTKKQLHKIVLGIVRKGRSFSKIPVCIVTLNPEILLKAKHDQRYKKFLEQFDLRIADGFGIVFCSLFLKRQVIHRFAGADLAGVVIEEALKNKLKVALVMDKEGLSSKEELKFFLKEKFGQKKSNLCRIYLEDKESGEQEKLSKNTQVLFVGLGAPSQEEFILKNKEDLPDLRLAIGTGGTFDYWTKRTRRAPKLMRIFGFEWLWRVLILRGYSKKKQRIKRVFSAVFIFPIKYIFDNSK